MDALIAVMQEEEYNEDGHLDPVLPYVLAQREKLVRSEERPSYPWSDELGDELEKVFPEDLLNEVFDIVLPEGMRLLAIISSPMIIPSSCHRWMREGSPQAQENQAPLTPTLS